jgi:hypothetical protein
MGWLTGTPHLWKLDADSVVYTGDLASWLARAYNPLQRAGLFSDFQAIGAAADALDGPQREKRLQRLSLHFVRDYGPLVSRFDNDSSPPIRVNIAELVSEARDLSEAVQAAERMQTTDENLSTVVAGAVNRHIDRVHRTLGVATPGVLVFREVCDDLLAAIWFHFAKTLDAGGAWQRCANPGCRRLFATTSNRRQGYHDPACRNRAHVARRAKEKRI